MKKRQKINEIETKEQAVKYLEKVLSFWEAFADSHRPFAKAIKILIADAKEIEVCNEERKD